MNRRAFHLTLIYGLWSLTGIILALPAAVYLLWPPRAKKEDEWVDAGSLKELALETPEEFVFRRNRIDGWKITSEKTTAWVVKRPNNEVIAFSPQCPHLGCAYHWEAENKEFLCPCHSSTFSIEGKVITGPAPRALDRFEAKVEGEKLLMGSIQKSSVTRS